MILTRLRALLAGLRPSPGISRGGAHRRLTPDEMMPDPDAFSVGGGDFKGIGSAFVEELKRSCDLTPHQAVLDVGCGIGRIAIPLTQYLSPEGRYEGFDPVVVAIRHCRERITPSYPNFHFELADTFNKQYNPRGRFKDHEYRFPYADATFDVVFAVSVYTHLLPEGTERYIAESARVLKPGGQFLATFFLLNEVSKAAIEAGNSTLSFPVHLGAHRVQVPDIPEAAVAHEESVIMGLYEKYGFNLKRKAGYGSWSGRAPSEYGGYQDLLVATSSPPKPA